MLTTIIGLTYLSSKFDFGIFFEFFHLIMMRFYWGEVLRNRETSNLFGSFPVPPPLFKIPSFMFVLRVITAKRVMLRCKV